MYARRTGPMTARTNWTIHIRTVLRPRDATSAVSSRGPPCAMAYKQVKIRKETGGKCAMDAHAQLRGRWPVRAVRVGVACPRTTRPDMNPVGSIIPAQSAAAASPAPAPPAKLSAVCYYFSIWVIITSSAKALARLDWVTTIFICTSQISRAGCIRKKVWPRV